MQDCAKKKNNIKANLKKIKLKNTNFGIKTNQC